MQPFLHSLAAAVEALVLKEKPKTPNEFIFSFLRLCGILGYAGTNAGLSLQYPSPVPNTTLGWIEAIITFVVYLGIADSSFDNFFTQADLGFHAAFKKLLENARAADKNGVSLQEYYDKLSPSDKTMLVKILKQYTFEWAFKIYKDFFNVLNNPIANEMFHPDLRRLLNNFDADRARSRASSVAVPAFPTQHPADEKQAAASASDTSATIQISAPQPHDPDADEYAHGWPLESPSGFDAVGLRRRTVSASVIADPERADSGIRLSRT